MKMNKKYIIEKVGIRSDSVFYSVYNYIAEKTQSSLVAAMNRQKILKSHQKYFK